LRGIWPVIFLAAAVSASAGDENPVLLSVDGQVVTMLDTAAQWRSAADQLQLRAGAERWDAPRLAMERRKAWDEMIDGLTRSKLFSIAAQRYLMDLCRRSAAAQMAGGGLGADEIQRAAEAKKGEILGRLAEQLKRTHYANAGGEDAILDILRRKEVAWSDWERRLVDQMLVDAFLDSQLGAEEPSPALMREHYREHADEFREPALVKARHILLDPRDAAGPEAAMAHAHELRTAIAGGADFARIAMKYSRDKFAPDGGLMRDAAGSEFFGRGTFLAQVEAAAFSLEPGRLSEVVESPAGLHIVQVLDRRGGAVKPFAQVQDEIRVKLATAERERRAQEIYERLRRGASVKVFAKEPPAD